MKYDFSTCPLCRQDWADDKWCYRCKLKVFSYTPLNWLVVKAFGNRYIHWFDNGNNGIDCFGEDGILSYTIEVNARIPFDIDAERLKVFLTFS